MIQPFRKIRQKLVTDGSLKRYLLYAIGEILLVVIGILLALQINNWNEDRKERQIEKEILTGIRNNILQDTIDISGNIHQYQRIINNNILLLDHLLKKKKYDPSIAYRLSFCIGNDLTLTLHNSHFEEAKQRGLEIIQNKDLQQRISRLYEFKYSFLLFLENDFEINNSYMALRSLVNPYLEIALHDLPLDSLFSHQNQVTINPESYSRLLLDKKLQFQILSSTKKDKSVLNNDYLPTKKEALKVVDLINEELTKFD